VIPPRELFKCFAGDHNATPDAAHNQLFSGDEVFERAQRYRQLLRGYLFAYEQWLRIHKVLPKKKRAAKSKIALRAHNFIGTGVESGTKVPGTS